MIDFDGVLELYFAGHQPTRPAWSSQYRSAIFYGDDRQRRLAEAKIAALIERSGKQLFVDLLPAETFYRAEDYHQKYLLQRHGELTAELCAPYPDFTDFVDSTAAARLNGYLGGARPQQLETEDLARLGLSEKGRRVLRKSVRGPRGGE